jgi:hypothetical protein
MYTRGLPVDERTRRRDEIDDDLSCQRDEALSMGRTDRSLGGELLVRLVLGIPADLSWRMARGRQAARGRMDRRASMGARIVGVLTAFAGLSWGALVIVYVRYGEAMWTGSIGQFSVATVMIGALAFALATIGILIVLQDRVTVRSAIGGLLIVVGAWGGTAGAAPGSVLLLPIGAVLLTWDLARMGVVSRWLVVAQAGFAIAAVVTLAVGQPLTTGLVWPFAGFLVTWVVVGVILFRGVPEAHAAHG